jgi:large subunit ribosomal protein L18
MAKTKRSGYLIRQKRVRGELRARTAGRPSLSVHRSEANIYAQVIDDAAGKTLAAASSVEKGFKGSLKTGASSDAAKAVGKALAERAMKAGVSEVYFDRGGYLYHGRVKALAEAARETGLKF